jgi:hypothetical protein
MSERTVTFVSATVIRFPGLKALFAEHRRDNFGEVLPHVFFGDFTRYVIALLDQEQAGVAGAGNELREILAYLENSYAEGDEDICELIVVSFLENLTPWAGQDVRIREFVGPHLRHQLDVMARG